MVKLCGGEDKFRRRARMDVGRNAPEEGHIILPAYYGANLASSRPVSLLVVNRT